MARYWSESGSTLRMRRGDVGGIDGVVGDELGEVVFLVGDVDVEVEVLRVDAADAEVGDVAHDADGHGGVELGDGVGGGVGVVVRGGDSGDGCEAVRASARRRSRRS